MKKFFLIICAAIIFLNGCGGNIRGVEKLKVGIDDGYAPLGFRNEQNEIVGFDVDLAKEVARRMGIELEFIPIKWSTKENELQSGKIDMIWNGLDITPERREVMLFSKPYMDNRQILLVRKDDERDIISQEDLEDKIVGTQAGSNSETYINSNENLRNSFLEFRTFPNFRIGFELLKNGKVDVLIVDELAGRYETNRHADKLRAVAVTIGPPTEIGIGFRKDNTVLRDRIQKVFDGMIRDGTAKKISEQWFNADLIKSRG